MSRVRKRRKRRTKKQIARETKANSGWQALSLRQRRVIGVLYMAWQTAKIYAYPLFCLPKAIAFHKSTKLMRGVFGGNRSSKTTTAAAEVVMFALGIDFFRDKSTFPEPPFLIWIISKDFGTAKDVTLQKILFWLPKHEIDQLYWTPQRHEILLKNGVLIQFRSWEQGYERQKGREVALILFDEEPEDENVFRETEARTIGSGFRAGEIIVSCTPDKGFTYVIDRMYFNTTGDPEVAKFKFSSYDNYYISRGAVKRFHEHGLAGNKAEIDMRIWGTPAVRTGLVFSEWNPTIYDETRNPAGCIMHPFVPKSWWNHYVSLDPGADFFAASWFFVDDDRNAYLYRCMHWTDVPYSQIAQQIKTASAGVSIKLALIDGSEKAAMQEMNLWGVYCQGHRDYAVNLEEADKRGEMEAGIQRVKYYWTGATGCRLWVFSDCTEVHKQLGRHIREKSGKPEQKFKHFPDTIRYFLSIFPPASQPISELNPNSIEAIEERLLGTLDEFEDEMGDRTQDKLYAELEKDLYGNPVSTSGHVYF